MKIGDVVYCVVGIHRPLYTISGETSKYFRLKDGTLFSKKTGRERGRYGRVGGLTRYSVATPEIISAIREENTIYKARLLMHQNTKLSITQAKAIIEILEPKE